jgi:hypothetical protein
MCLAACKSYVTLAIVRLFLGFVEAGFSPGVLFLLSSCEFFADVVVQLYSC